MADLVTDYAGRSLAEFLEGDGGLPEAYVVTPDFDWDKKPHPITIGKQVGREMPYAGVLMIQDQDDPFTMSANILRERSIDFHVIIIGSSYTEMVQKTSDAKQALVSAVTPITSGVGIVLWNFADPSGAFFSQAGTMQVELAPTQYFGASDQSEEGNRKYRSITPLTLSMFKDSTATLLENTGRVSLTDS
tara:strand:+ start:2459 stop:3028 length:570 start_codon:yes stop_codon:yes gene_type:complete